MAIASDRTVTSERERSARSDLVLAGDRTGSRQSARKHTNRVRTLKYALPLAAFGGLAIFGVSMLSTLSWKDSLPSIDIPQIIPENLAMENPHYEGFTTDGGRYWVNAARAQQDLKSLTTLKLETITGELTGADKSVTKLSAVRGVYDSKASLLELFEQIEISGDNGLKAKLTRATVKNKEGLITSDEPVSVAMQAGAITANHMTIRQKAKEYTFLENVRTTVKPAKAEPAKPAAMAAAPALPLEKAAADPFAASDEPINITSNRLDINDVAKTAIFSGQVSALQGDGSLAAPEMTVTYEGEAAVVGAPKSDGGKVKRILAQSPVELRQATGEIVTGHSAEFDTAAKKAVIDGDVVMTQQPDKRATGDRVEFDQSTNTMLLTGAVMLTQGQNQLRGTRLYFDRLTSRMQLTAPGPTGAAGRVFARFHQSGSKSAQTAAPEEAAKPQRGIPFGANFKTTPGAPVNVEATRLDVDDTAKRAVFTGNVKAIQGEFIIQAAELTATYTGSAGLAGDTAGAAKSAAADLSRMKARTNVTITSNDGQRATGDWADFDPRANIATLGGDVVLTQGKNVVRGTKLVIDMKTGETVVQTEPAENGGGGAMISSSDGTGAGPASKSQRPSAVFYPAEMKDRAKKAVKGAADGWQARNAP